MISLVSITCFVVFQSTWKTEILEQLQIIQVEGSKYPKLEEELIKRRKEELRSADDSDTQECSSAVPVFFILSLLFSILSFYALFLFSYY